MRIERTSAVAVAALTALASIGVAAWALRPQPSAAAVDPGNFTSPVPNPYFPITPGKVLHYRGSEDGVHYRERVEIADTTKTIQGVTTTVVLDVLRRADGSLAEKTHDWYADDNSGNVWYFGENTATYDRHGHVRSREGSWEAGVDGARAGLIMPAHPAVTDAYRQEFLAAQAEDQAWIVERGFSVTTPYGTMQHVVRSFEWTRLERNVISLKLYAPGLGIVKEMDKSGGNEQFELVAVTHT
jgi:hypothetical protein